MTDVLRIAVGVSTPLALLGLLAALGYFAYARKLKHQEKQLDTLPPEQRGAAIDEYLTRYGIEGKNLKTADKLELIKREMEQRHRRAVLYVVVAAIVVVVCFALAVVAYLFHNHDGNPQEADLAALHERLNKLQEQTFDLQIKVAEYQTKNKDKNDPPSPDEQLLFAHKQLSKDLEETNKKVAAYEIRYGPISGANDTLREANQVVKQAFSLGMPLVVIPARLATMHLTTKAEEGVQQLLEDRPLYDPRIVGWAYSIRRRAPLTAKYPNNSRWHFVNIPVGEQRLVLDRDCPESYCLVAAIPKFQKVVASQSASPEDRREALMFLVCLVAELHQPLHCATRNNDAGGNRVKVVFANESDSLRPNLHYIWDTFLLKQRLAQANPLDYAIQLNGKISANDRDKWVRGTIEDWAWESHEIAVRHAYAGIPADGSNVKIGEDYIRKNGLVMEQQMKKAGIRLAFLVNQSFQ